MRLSGLVVAVVLVAGLARPLSAAEEEAFPGYEPKLTPDTVLDYRPELAIEIGALPPAELGSLPELIRALDMVAARGEPGRWEDGRIMLGAEPTEYIPSDDELIVAEVGERIGQIVADTVPEDVEQTLAAAGITRRAADYGRFTFRHADVMGSGRFFYASPPEPVRVTLGPVD
jgi:hypothetical protein